MTSISQLEKYLKELHDLRPDCAFQALLDVWHFQDKEVAQVATIQINMVDSLKSVRRFTAHSFADAFQTAKTFIETVGPTRLVVNTIRPPIPKRDFDFQAYFEGDEETSSLIGWGATAKGAVVALQDIMLEDPPANINPDVLQKRMQVLFEHLKRFDSLPERD